VWSDGRGRSLVADGLGTVSACADAVPAPVASADRTRASRSHTKAVILPRSALRARTPIRVPALLSLVLSALVVLTVLAPGSAASVDTDTPVDADTSVDAAGGSIGGSPEDPFRAVAASSAGPDAEDELDRTEAFAEVEGLELLLPSHEVVVHAFHEASWSGALELTPIGSAQHVLPSRGRPTPATSAADVVLADDVAVRSPVTGTVEEVERFELYGRYRDRKVTIIPDEAPDLRVVAIHISVVHVAAGDRVEAGVTEIAKRARRFPFKSQIDDLTAPDSWPHVHLEVKRADTE
jgi:hypothetical protein